MRLRGDPGPATAAAAAPPSAANRSGAVHRLAAPVGVPGQGRRQASLQERPRDPPAASDGGPAAVAAATGPIALEARSVVPPHANLPSWRRPQLLQRHDLPLTPGIPAPGSGWRLRGSARDHHRVRSVPECPAAAVPAAGQSHRCFVSPAPLDRLDAKAATGHPLEVPCQRRGCAEGRQRPSVAVPDGGRRA